MKTCCRFKTGKCVSETNPQPDEDFAKDRKRKDGLTPHCKKCLKVFREVNKEQRNATIKKWRAEHPEIMRGYRIKHAVKTRVRNKKWREKNRLQFLYNISNDDWAAIFNAQGGKCKICSTHAKDLKRGLCVDHCHETNKVRGLLCHVCNKAIGLMRDDVEILKRAILYLTGSDAY